MFFFFFVGLDNTWHCHRWKPTTLNGTDFEILVVCSAWLRNEKCWVSESCDLQKCVKTLVALRWNLSNGSAWTSKWQQYVLSCRIYARFNIVFWLNSIRVCAIQHSSLSVCGKRGRREYLVLAECTTGRLLVTCSYDSTSCRCGVSGVVLGRALLVSSLPVRWSGLIASEAVLRTVHYLYLQRS